MSELILNSPWYFYALSLLPAAIVSYWLYGKNKATGETAVGTRSVLFGLRFLSTFLVCLLLLNIFLRRTLNQTENPIVVFAFDNSASMLSAKDSSDIKNGFLDRFNELKKNISQKYAVKNVLFGNEGRESEALPDFKDKETDLESLFDVLENNYSGANIGALVVVSDGINNRGSAPTGVASKHGFPVFTIATGDTTENRDVYIKKIEHNQVAYLGNNFPAEVVINAKKAKGSTILAELYENTVLRGEQKLLCNTDNFSGVCSFTMNAAKPGTVKYTVKLKPLDGEKNSANNVQSFVVEIIDNREKLLILAQSPHPDIAALRQSLEDPGNYEVTTAYYESGLPPLKPYSLVILHGYTSKFVSAINECRSSAVPFWIVNPGEHDNLPGIKINGGLGRTNDAEPYPEKTFGLFGISGDLQRFSNSLPAVKVAFGNYQSQNGIQVLLKQKLSDVETDYPLLYFGETEGLKYGVFAGDGLWRWKFRDYSEHSNTLLFGELVHKCVQYLSVKNDKSFFRLTPPRIIDENQDAEFGAEVYNKSYQPITEPDVNLKLINQNGESFNYVFSKAPGFYKLNVGKPGPGEYSYEASVKQDGELMIKKGSFTVREIVAERINSVANHALLSQLATRSGGKMFGTTQLKELERELMNNESIKPVTYSQRSVSPLIELKWLFFVVLVLFALEWWIRKREFQI